MNNGVLHYASAFARAHFILDCMLAESGLTWLAIRLGGDLTMTIMHRPLGECNAVELDSVLEISHRLLHGV